MTGLGKPDYTYYNRLLLSSRTAGHQLTALTLEARDCLTPTDTGARHNRTTLADRESPHHLEKRIFLFAKNLTH